MRYARPAVSRAMIGMAVVIIIVVAGGAAYFALGPAGPKGSSTTSTSATSTSSISSTSSSTSASKSSSTTSASTTSAVSCTSSTSSTSSSTTTSTTTSTVPQGYTFLVRLLGNFSSMSVKDTGYYRNSTANTYDQYNYTDSYQVLSSPKTGSADFKANFTETYTNPPKTGIAWIEPNGTVVAVFMNGTNSTGPAAFGELGQLASSFTIIYFYGTSYQSYLALPGVHEINKSTVMLGPTSLMVTNYGITSPSSFCNGSGVISDTNFQLQVGNIPGTTLPLVSFWSQTGSFTPQSGHGTISSSSTSRVTSVTKA